MSSRTNYVGQNQLYRPGPYAGHDQLFDRGLFMLSKPNFDINSNYLVYNQFCRPKIIICPKPILSSKSNYIEKCQLCSLFMLSKSNFGVKSNYVAQNHLCGRKEIILSTINFVDQKAIMLSKSNFGVKSNYIVHNQFCWTKSNYVVQKQLCCPQSLLSNKSNYCVQDLGRKQV